MRLTPRRLELVEGSTKRITFDLAPIAGAATLSSVTIESDPSGVAVTSTAISDKTVSCLVSGGSGGSNYDLKVTVALSGGETEVGSIQLRWKEVGDYDSAGA